MKPSFTTITIANQKGGVAKTTTAVTLAHGLSLRNKEVLLLDVDPQGQCASALGLEQEAGVFNFLVVEKPLRDVVRTTGRKSLFLLPGNKRTGTAQFVLSKEQPGLVDPLVSILRNSFKDGGPDYIIIDTAPSVGGLQEMALWAADLVIIPTATDSLATEGVAEVVATLQSLRDKHQWPGAVLGILPTFFDEVTKESKTVLDDLRESLGSNLILDPIHRATVLRECAAHGKTIFEYADTSRAAEEYAALVWKVLDYE